MTLNKSKNIQTKENHVIHMLVVLEVIRVPYGCSIIALDV